MKLFKWQNVILVLMVTAFDSTALSEDLHIQSGGRTVKVLTPSNRSKNSSSLPPKQGLWFVEEMQPQEQGKGLSTSARTVDNVTIEDGVSNLTPVERKQYSIGEARARLIKAKSQLERDKNILAKYADEADPNKMELWRTRIEQQEKRIREKEKILQRIETRYVSQQRQERESRLYEDQSKYYQKLEAVSADLSFK